MIDLRKYSGGGPWQANENKKRKYFSGLLKNSPKLVNLVKELLKTCHTSSR
jgi:hypothetical protein